MNMLRTGRRRKILVDPRFQVAPVLMGLGFIAAVTVFLALPLLEAMRAVNALLDGQNSELIRYYKTQQTSTLVSIVLFLGGVVGLWTASMLWRTHKIAGPIVKITRQIHQYATGDFWGRIQLREKDELQALANAINGMADSFQERDRAVCQRVLTQIDSAKRALHDASSVERAVGILDRLVENVQETFDVTPASSPSTDDAERKAVYSQS